MALLFLEIYRTQLVKHGTTWSDLQVEAAWAGGWSGDLPLSFPNYPMALWGRLGAACYRMLSEIKTACVTVWRTHIQLNEIWIKRLDEIRFIHRQVIEGLQWSLFSYNHIMFWVERDLKDQFLLISAHFSGISTADVVSTRADRAKPSLWFSTVVHTETHSGDVVFDFLIRLPCSLRRQLFCLSKKINHSGGKVTTTGEHGGQACTETCGVVGVDKLL